MCSVCMFEMALPCLGDALQYMDTFLFGSQIRGELRGAPQTLLMDELGSYSQRAWPAAAAQAIADVHEIVVRSDFEILDNRNSTSSNQSEQTTTINHRAVLEGCS